MKITVIYGNHTQASQKRFYYIIDAVKKRGWEVNFIQKDTRSLAEKITSNSFFEEQKLFVLDDLSVLTSKDLQWLPAYCERSDANLLVYHDAELPKKFIDALGKNAKLEKFVLPKTVFAFLEAIKPKNLPKVLDLFHLVIENEPVELVMALLSSHLRDLIWIKTDPNSLKIPAWRVTKLQRQAQAFSEKHLSKMIHDLAEIDIKVKTSDVMLASQLDLFLVASLQ